MPNTYTLIEKITVGAAGASSITFTSIPQTYTDLKIVVSARTNWSNSVNADGINIRPNGSTSSRTAIRLYGSGSAAGSDTNINPIAASNASSTASTFGNAEIYIPNYAGSTNKSMSVDGVSETNGTTTYAGLAAFLWSNTAAITSLDIYPENGTSFSQYSTFYLYGIAKEGVTPAPSSAPYATGGDSIVFDGTYWYHTFLSSGTFTPKKGLTCDYLVVAGGGGGNTGGGGAGGLRSTVTATGGGGSLESALSLAANTGYTVTVGAGGAGVGYLTGQANDGSNSVFSTITSTGGGGAGATPGYGTTSGRSGGSGGGGGRDASSTGGAGTANQGYAGGNGNVGPFGVGGSGGGAGAAGANGRTATSPATLGMNGGNGVAVSITGSSVSYAGGGASASNLDSGSTATPTGGTGGGGNGASTPSTNGGNGTANTGGGGGGCDDATGGNGGSGIVIVRYAA